MLKPKNIIIFIAAGAILVLIYVFFIKPSPEPTGLVSTSTTSVTGDTTLPEGTSGDTLGTNDFLVVLLNVKNIKLDDSIFSDPAFATLRDSSIILTPDGTEGRPNPFAPIGSDSTVPAGNTNTTNTTNGTTNTATTTPPATGTPPSVTTPSSSMSPTMPN